MNSLHHISAEKSSSTAQFLFYNTIEGIGDGKYREKETYEEAGICIMEISPDLRLASGRVGLLRYLYPELEATGTYGNDFQGASGLERSQGNRKGRT